MTMERIGGQRGGRILEFLFIFCFFIKITNEFYLAFGKMHREAAIESFVDTR